MGSIKIFPGCIKGIIQAPPSKSLSQRALAAALLRTGETIIQNIGNSEDELAAISVLESLGATCIQLDERTLKITSQFPKQPVQNGHIDCGESGLALRMFTPIAALQRKQMTITGRGSLLKRPTDFFLKVLPQLGVKINTPNGFLPFEVQGPLHPQSLTLDGSLSSQFLTGLLFAYAAATAEDVTLTVDKLNSRPYIDLTLTVLRDFGLPCPEVFDYHKFYFPPQESKRHIEHSMTYAIEGDWSGAAFLLVAGALTGTVTLSGLNILSNQADKKILEVLQGCGCGLSIKENAIIVQAAALKSFRFDATQCPDLFPPLVALAAHCRGISVIKGVKRLLHKESNRALTLQSEFEKLGIRIEIENNEMLIHGGTVNGGEVTAHGDHRIAMALSVAGLKAETVVVIGDSEAVHKSYPRFYRDLKDLGILCTGL